METDEPSKPGRVFLLSLGIIGIIVGGAIAGEFVLRLQPGLTVANECPTGSACVSMPPDATTLGFLHNNITIIIGLNNTVVWTNDDTVLHTVFSTQVPQGASTFQSAVMGKGDTFSQTLTVPGVYDYHCSIHPATMTGTITVKAAA